MNDAQGPTLLWRYAAIATAILMLVLIVNWYFCWGPPTTVLLVRHADRQPTADALSPAGEIRAQQLAHVMERSEISAIYTSEAIRTQQTAAPTATALGVTPTAVAAVDVAGLVSTIRADHSGQKVLVVGHSDTVPQIVAELGGPAVAIGGNEYDRLFVLTVCACRRGRVELTSLQYGAPSP